jgi:hypothetical protein
LKNIRLGSQSILFYNKKEDDGITSKERIKCGELVLQNGLKHTKHTKGIDQKRVQVKEKGG